MNWVRQKLADLAEEIEGIKRQLETNLPDIDALAPDWQHVELRQELAMLRQELARNRLAMIKGELGDLAAAVQALRVEASAIEDSQAKKPQKKAPPRKQGQAKAKK